MPEFLEPTPKAEKPAKMLRAGEVTIEIKNFVTPPGLPLDLVRVHGSNLSFDTKGDLVRLAEDADLEVHLYPQTLADYLNFEKPAGLEQFRASLINGFLQIEAVKKILVEFRAKTTLRLVVVNQVRIEVELVEVDVMGVAPKGLVQQALDAINPVFEVDMLPFQLRLQSVEVLPDFILVRAKIHREPFASV